MQVNYSNFPPLISKPKSNDSNIKKNKENVHFAGSSDTFKKRLERDQLVFSDDLKTVLDFYESLPFKTVFQSKETREQIESLMLQREHAAYSQRVLKHASSGGSFMNRLFKERWKETGLAEEKQKAIFKNSLEHENLSMDQSASTEDMAKLLAQYYSHEASEAVGNNFGVGELSDKATEDAQNLMHSGMGIMARSIKFMKNDPDMARIVQNRQLLTNPSVENLEAALDDWSGLFRGEGSGTFGVTFSGRTDKYGKKRHSPRETMGIIALSVVGISILSSIPALGYPLANWMNKGYTLKRLSRAYKLDLPNPAIEKDLKSAEKFVRTTQALDKAANTAVTGIAGIGTAGFSLPITVALGVASGIVSESYALYYVAREFSKYSRNLYDSVEDYPNVKIKDKVQTPSEVQRTLSELDAKRDTADSSQFDKFRGQSYSQKEIDDFYNSYNKKSNEKEKKTSIFSEKNRIDNKLESTDLFRHIVHVSKKLNPNFKMDFPLKTITEHRGALKLLKIFSLDDQDGWSEEDDI